MRNEDVIDQFNAALISCVTEALFVCVRVHRQQCTCVSQAEKLLLLVPDSDIISLIDASVCHEICAKWLNLN